MLITATVPFRLSSATDEASIGVAKHDLIAAAQRMIEPILETAVARGLRAPMPFFLADTVAALRPGDDVEGAIANASEWEESLDLQVHVFTLAQMGQLLSLISSLQDSSDEACTTLRKIQDIVTERPKP